MVGGVVKDVIPVEDGTTPRVWINCVDTTYADECAIYVVADENARLVRAGDKVWWQGRKAFWTRQGAKDQDEVDVALERFGYSGVGRPTRGREEEVSEIASCPVAHQKRWIVCDACIARILQRERNIYRSASREVAKALERLLERISRGTLTEGHRTEAEAVLDLWREP